MRNKHWKRLKSEKVNKLNFEGKLNFVLQELKLQWKIKKQLLK